MEVDNKGGFSKVRAENLIMTVTSDNHRQGQNCYVTFRADDIILSVGELPRLSSRNLWRGKVVSFERFGEKTIVTVDVGRKIRATLTEQSLTELELEQGKEVHVIVKANSMRTVALGTKENLESELAG